MSKTTNESSGLPAIPGLISSDFAKALLRVQGGIKAIAKDAENPFFNSPYATLNGVLNELKPLLQEHGIVLLQFPAQSGYPEAVGLTTKLIFVATGETLEETAQIPLTKLDPQAFGSAITYARRYAVKAIFGMQDEDEDDGNAASFTPAPKPSAEKPKGSFKLGGGAAPAAKKTALFPSLKPKGGAS